MSGEDFGNCSCGRARVRDKLHPQFAVCPVCKPPSVRFNPDEDDIFQVLGLLFGDSMENPSAGIRNDATVRIDMPHAESVYRTRPTKGRRTKQDVDYVKAAIRRALEEDAPMTVRQVFYRLVSAGVIGKTENEYKSTVCRLLGEMRLSGEIPFGWIADNTRWMRKPRTFSSLQSALKRTAEAYRRALWDNQDAYVEVWLEKDALAGVLVEETDKWDVPLMVTRGYPSLSYLYSAAETIQSVGKPTYLYYFGDHDPSGLDIPRTVEARIREFAPRVDLHFQRVAVMPKQIAEMNLPTRPTKKTDSRAKGFIGGSVEVDAIMPRVLRTIAHNCIVQHIDENAYTVTREAEKSEREALTHISNLMRDAA